MRTVFIDLTQDGHCRHDSIDVGYTGEHNATELVIAVPPSMADESEYLTAVFLSNGKIIRSEKITETQEDGKPYLTGNQVHILLSKRLTQSPTLGLQIEGYKKNKRGTSVLLGKSPFISSLHFHLSPQGEQDAAAGVDPDELSDLMDWWRNREDSSEYDSDEMSELLNWWRNRTDSSEQYSGELSDLLDWWRNRKDDETPAASGIRKVQRFQDLSRDAEDGDLAYVLNDSGSIHNGTVASWDYYAGFVFKDDLDRDVLRPLMNIELEDYMPSDYRYVGLNFQTDKYEDICSLSLIYSEPVGSLFVFNLFACEMDTLEYLPWEERGLSGYIYCCGEGDVSHIFNDGNVDPESSYLTKGWYTFKQIISGYTVEGNYPEPIISIVIEPIERCEITPLDTLRDCYVLVSNGEYKSYEKDVLSLLPDFFDCYMHEIKLKGLYMVEDDHWIRQKNMGIITVHDRTWLSKTAEIGQVAIVRNNTWFLVPERSYLYVGKLIDKIYINPVLGSNAWLADCRISAKYVMMNNQTGDYELIGNDLGLDITASEKNGYVLLSMNSGPLNDEKLHFLYSKEPGQIDLPSNSQFGNTEPCTLYVGKGWHRVYVYGNVCDAFETNPYYDIPQVILSNYGSEYRLQITEYDCIFSDQPYIANVPLFVSDEGKGVWYFGGGRWRKVDAQT